MILISVLYQNASTCRILEPRPQGLISSCINLGARFLLALIDNLILKTPWSSKFFHLIVGSHYLSQAEKKVLLVQKEKLI
jgi:hypothetical protein